MDETAPSRGVGLGGCGNKCKALIENVCDAYITSGLSYWDICACEPLVRARGGTFFLGNMDKITYYDGNDYINGLIAFRTVKVQELMKRR
jgi:3'-phosphoadenosine 5'-phosphosulfate (PAPS) 3'-phosphatase